MFTDVGGNYTLGSVLLDLWAGDGRHKAEAISAAGGRETCTGDRQESDSIISSPLSAVRSWMFHGFFF